MQAMNLTQIALDTDNVLDYILSKFSLNDLPSLLSFEYSVIEGYDNPKGKFPTTFGNTAFIDCHYVLDSVLP